VGDVPRGLPSVVVPDPLLLLDNAATVGLASVALVMIGFSQTAGDARMFAARHRYRVDIDQESLAQGAANVGAGLLQGMPVSTSLSASSLNDRTGARSPVASLTSGVMVLLTLVLLAPLFSGLPTAVLAAIIIEAVVMGMMDVAGLRRLFRVQRFDFWIAIAALVSTLVVGVLAGVLIGIGLSLLWLVSVTTRPSLPLMAREPGTQVFREHDEYPDDQPEQGVAVIRIDGGLFFATSDAIQDRVREVADAQPDARVIVIDCGAVAVIDAQGAATLHEILDLARDTDVVVRLARLKPAVRATLARDGVVDRLGTDRIHGSVHRAVEAHRAQGAASPEGADVERPGTGTD
ncbi:SulP family inorganic anion transporter, partial [Cellulomonas sp. P5_C6]